MRAKNIPPDADKFFCVRGESLFKKRGDLFKLFHAESGKQSYRRTGYAEILPSKNRPSFISIPFQSAGTITPAVP